MRGPTREQRRQMACHPLETAVRMTVDMLMLPIHIAYITAESIIHKFR